MVLHTECRPLNLLLFSLSSSLKMELAMTFLCRDVAKLKLLYVKKQLKSMKGIVNVQ